jgi:hypothetical protein
VRRRILRSHNNNTQKRRTQHDQSLSCWHKSMKNVDIHIKSQAHTGDGDDCDCDEADTFENVLFKAGTLRFSNLDTMRSSLISLVVLD